jgi:TldD protein
VRHSGLVLLLLVGPWQAAHGQGQIPPLLDILQQELGRNFQILKEKADPPSYFMAYTVTEDQGEILTASFGSLQNAVKMQRRLLDLSVRVGSPQFDNFHPLKGERPRFTAGRMLPLEDKTAPLQRILWFETDRAYRSASQRFTRLKTSVELKARDDKPALPDFSQEKPSEALLPVARLPVPGEDWQARLRRLSAEFNKFPGLLAGDVSLWVRSETKSFVNTEGARLQHGRQFIRLAIVARAKAPDGQDLLTTDSFEAAALEELPKEEVVRTAVQRVAAQIQELLKASEAEPFVGPAILSGRAAGVFFHEIFGHRVEGHRLRDETDGQTFAKSVNSAVLPDFLNVTFDPTRRKHNGLELQGWYHFDDEGVPARSVPLVEQGILKTFLASREPVPGVEHSNGHGRRAPGYEPVARQSTLVVDSSRSADDKQLRRLLLNEVVRQNKPYGLYFAEVTGGYTTTSRPGLQAYTVIPLVVFRIYPDGRPDELVRGLDIVGTPLASFAKILATGERQEVFNGICGAESGGVPVSAIAPALLVGEIEVQRKPSSNDRPPLLGRPTSIGSVP